jgi:hypothetical protein
MTDTETDSTQAGNQESLPLNDSLGAGCATLYPFSA